MKSVYIALCALVISLGVTGWLYWRQSAPLDLRCEAEVRHTVARPDGQVTLDVTATLFMQGNGEGFVNLYGVLSHGQQSWLVNRKLSFSWRYQRSDKIYDVRLRRVEMKNSLDSAPEQLLAQIYTPHFYMEIQRIGPNGVLLRGLSGPWFICRA